MEYKVYKLEFQGGVHFGSRSLEDGEYTFCADTLFSALSQEALKMGANKLQCFYQYVKTGKLLISDAFPYMGDTYFLPKPVKKINTEEVQGDSTIKKAFKKLKYIPAEQFDIYLNGNFDVKNAQDMNKLGKFEMKVSAAIRGEEETKPYRVGIYFYNKGNGLYIIIGFTQQEAADLTEELLKNLSFSGIGGKRTAGLGRFNLLTGKLPSDIQNRLERKGKQYMTLSVSLPIEDELEMSLEEAEYILCKRSGFVASDKYAQEQRRKRDLYVLKAGSCVHTLFQGDVYDVSDGSGSHPVYRYAKPMFMEVDT